MPDPETFAATLIVTFGRHARVRSDAGRAFDARPMGRKMDCVCGDRVDCRHDPGHDEVHIVGVQARRNLLQRGDARGRSEPVVANVDLLAVVAAPAPAPDYFLIDRYLAAAHCVGIDAMLIANKLDLEGGETTLHALRQMAEPLGIRVIAACATLGHGIAELHQQFAGRTGVLVGQSGVGKSSLLQALLPANQLRIQELDRDDEGRHTTTRSEMYALPQGGAIIDSPGVRDFVPAISALEPRALGFAEIEKLAPGCRFADCKHMREPNCAVLAAVANGGCDARRYESYRRLRRLFEDLQPAPGSRRSR
jgi:ribosome biogenesis GTPase / thiamine phosphate phosphatase